MLVRLRGGDMHGSAYDVEVPLPNTVIVAIDGAVPGGPRTATYRLASGFSDPPEYHFVELGRMGDAIG